MKVCLQLVFKVPPPPPPPPPTAPTPAATATPAVVRAPPAPPPGPRTLKLTEGDVLVTFGTAAGTNMHRSVEGERGAWSRDREVNNWSEGCQVFRSPHDFTNFMRMSMLAKRALCSSRSARCCAELKAEDVEKGIGANMTAHIKKHIEEFSSSANRALEIAFTPDAPKPPDPKVRVAIEKLVDESAAYKNFNNEVRSIFQTVFPTKKKEVYAEDDTFALMTSYTREKVLAALTEKSNEDDVKKTIAAGLEDYRKKLTETKATWLKAVQNKQIERKHMQFLAQGMEPCDFGDCGYRFDYLLAETSRANMEAFVAKLGDHSWSALFPEDALPTPPKKPKTPSPSKPAVAVNKPPTK